MWQKGSHPKSTRSLWGLAQGGSVPWMYGGVFIDLRLYKVEPKPEHCPECGGELIFPKESKHLNSLSARGKFGLSSSLRSHLSCMRQIGQTVLSCRLCRTPLSRLHERGSRALGRISLAWGTVPHRAVMP